ncbi:pilus assembly PilX N-terminal domain-containing protein [Thermus sp. NEB1569]|uniref:pilus assembly PilX N-terminal domain-containing protein n=1 Tax=Thermus sp. NEB1569 TaxID=2918899 RepID=UPI001EFC209A|nr:pilus assembly PilX N-terminal domain-containing protein [Thermus sp. NEB1569]ULR41548.1 pilus assembly PilX N-terminal domain-containing protein [Thermus sp. NEB1569]
MNTKGIALVATLALMVVIALLVFGTFFTTQIELWTTRNDTTSVQAFYAAEAGLQKYKAVLFQQYVWREQRGQGGGGPGCFTPLVTGLDLDRNGTLIPFTNNQLVLAEDEAVMDAFGNPVGRYRVVLYKDAQDGQLFTLVSQGTSSGAKATVQATFRISNTGYLEQAIFAGTGQANKWLNGGATIRGGIYVVGSPSDPDQTVIKANGNFALYNWYNLNDNDYSGIASRVESGYREVRDLCASLRVQYGKISVGGSTEIGEPTNKVKGVFVGRGAQDITGDVCQDQDKKGVCTEAMGGFDLSNPPPFPTLDAKLDSDACSAYPTWRNCLQNRAALRIQRLENRVSIATPLGVNLDSCLQALQSGTLTLDNKDVNCTFIRPDGSRGGFKYTYEDGKGLLQVFGDVVLEGLNLVLNQPTDYQASSGSAKSATFAVLAKDGAGGNLDINGSLLPDASFGSFPGHALGLVVEKNLYQRGQYVMAPLYAGGTFRVVQDKVLFGSVIANEFCTTSAGGQNTGNQGGNKNNKNPPFRIFNAYPLDKPKEKGALGELWKNTRRPLPSYPCPWRNWSPCSRHGSKPACQKGRENPAGPGPSPTSASFSSTWSAPSWASPANACAGNWPATLGSASASV